MTNHAAFAYADAPLFLFHLLEFSGLRYRLDVEELNKRWSKKEFIDSWAAARHQVDRRDGRSRHPRAADRHLSHGR